MPVALTVAKFYNCFKALKQGTFFNTVTSRGRGEFVLSMGFLGVKFITIQ